MLSNKVLVVEDYYDLREMLGMILTYWGWEPVLTSSGREALAKLEWQTPRVIIMDMRLPDMHGRELATAVKGHPSYWSIPILATTAEQGPAVRRRCFAGGCDDFIAKPFAIPALEKIVTNLASMKKPKAISANGQ